MTELETLKSILTTFVTTLYQSGIITPTGEKPIIGGDYKCEVDSDSIYALSIEALSKRVTTLEAALSQTHDTLEAYRQDSFARNEVADLIREEMKKAGAAGALKQEDLEDAISNYLSINDYLDSDAVDSKVEDALDSHDFSNSPKLKRIVSDLIDEADLEDAVKNALDGITVNRYLDLSDLASEIENEIDFDSKVSDALDNIDLSEKLDIAPAVQEQVDEKLSEYDFSEALGNTLSDSQVREALLKMLLEDLSKKLNPEPEKKDE